ncbi:response regulator [Cohnella sp.]|uniref:response regulator transcription factor n=1 Tax=Cohnella sp. TaxID=1883426 RepID=UPI003561F89B
MTTLLLVDDEPRQVKALSAILRKQRPEYRIIEAMDVETAWEKIETEPVDAVLTDIRMPDVDGLTLIERISRQKPHIKTVLISGYGQFDYAKQAIEHRVVEYLVKPIGLSDIERIIYKLEEMFAHESSLNQSVSVYHEHLWNALIAGKLDEQQRLELNRYIPADGPGITMVIELNQDQQTKVDKNIPNAVRQKWNKLLAPLGKCILFGDPFSGLFVTLIWLDRYLAAKPSETVSRITRLFEQLRTGEGMEEAVLGISTIRPALTEEARYAHEEALLALRHRFFAADEAIIWGSDIRAFTDKVTPGSKELAEPLTLAVKVGDQPRAIELVNAFFQKREAPPFPDPDLIKEELYMILWKMIEGLQSVIPTEAIELSHSHLKKKISRCGNYQELRFRFKKLVEELLELSGKSRQDKNGLIILQCQAYLQQHYMEDISLESVAAMFHFNPSYFSNLFKIRTGVNFSEYIISMRIKQAERILENTEDKISEISERVGFHNPSYFNKIFKRKTGISPNSFRQMKGKVGGG